MFSRFLLHHRRPCVNPLGSVLAKSHRQKWLNAVHASPLHVETQSVNVLTVKEDSGKSNSSFSSCNIVPHDNQLLASPTTKTTKRTQLTMIHHFLGSDGVRPFSSSSSSEPSTEDCKDNVASNESVESTSNSGTSSSVDTSDPTTEAETHEFQAETRQLLDIVINSLYTEKDVFIRELVSNASDALEKLRHLQAINSPNLSQEDADVPLEIRIDLDEVSSSITISDTGIGMTRDEMIRNLGTIARSGSKNFVKDLAAKNLDAAHPSASSIIGQFGVGFYSSFMVADKVEVRSRSALMNTDETDVASNGNNLVPPAHKWTSDGIMGSFQITSLSDDVRQGRGTSVVLYMKEEGWSYINEYTIEDILKRYSNFINFPIYLNGKRVNKQEALWSKDPRDVSEDEYSEFYKYFANAMDEPLDTYHFRTDAPIDMKVLFFTPSFHSEKFGLGRMEPGVNLYSRKILIEAKSPDILPEWMRFIKGVVDSEDLPLAISREKTQDSALIAKLRKTLVRKYIAHLTQMKKKDPEKFIDFFYKEYSFFLKEGICQDYEFQPQLAKLLHFHTSKYAPSSNKMISLDEYISNMRPEQNDIYYLVAPTQSAALSSPYLEAFKKAKVEVLFLYTAIEDFVMANLQDYEGRKLVSVDRGDIDLSALMKDIDATSNDDEIEDEKSQVYKASRELTVSESSEFCEWFRKEVGVNKVASCTVTSRLTESPAIVTDNESGSIRRMMRLIDTSTTGDGSSGRDSRGGIPLPKQHVEVNVKHKIIVGIYDIMKTEPQLAKTLAEQVYDNCLVTAGLLDDSRSMIPRLNDLLVCLVNGAMEQHKQTNEELPVTATEKE